MCTAACIIAWGLVCLNCNVYTFFFLDTIHGTFNLFLSQPLLIHTYKHAWFSLLSEYRLWVHLIFVCEFILYIVLNSFVGTDIFSPPEWHAKGYHYGVSSTVWTLGLTLYGMLQGDLAFKTKEEIVRATVIFRRTISSGIHYVALTEDKNEITQKESRL